ncbi:uncharacterized protein LAESUDRAFT_728837 [Laetiporus sulphureus 93-53]|uniref:Required for respiratory growth protein 9, mitochondrial n=1 Tax=Laetiporus sulphureus 93-53 TaxID=1314785 RepID=A0A165CZH5_9APHY|nr:uncharacterized protein LAESUDRAFT_728837 [Laetiporus sulphureus 93-53]KZT03817.1 hypothetical protein LAESUDRAFT_728837 [Laetiporus sulphureus 93-53]
MLSPVRSIKASTSASRSFANFYPTVQGFTPKKWGLGGHPAPKSLIVDESDEPKNQPSTSETAASKPLKPSKPPPRVTRLDSGHDAQLLREFTRHRKAIKAKLPEGWQPPRKLSREAMEALRYSHRVDPNVATTSALADNFRISPEAVRRILRSKWEPSAEKRAKVLQQQHARKEAWYRQMREEERKKQEEWEEVHRKKQEATYTRKNDRLTLT